MTDGFRKAQMVSTGATKPFSIRRNSEKRPRIAIRFALTEPSDRLQKGGNNPA
jgi:hypothetical protein